jgi:hypothetical protein
MQEPLWRSTFGPEPMGAEGGDADGGARAVLDARAAAPPGPALLLPDGRSAVRSRLPLVLRVPLLTAEPGAEGLAAPPAVAEVADRGGAPRAEAAAAVVPIERVMDLTDGGLRVGAGCGA